MSNFSTHRCTWSAAFLVCLIFIGCLLTQWPSMLKMFSSPEPEEATSSINTMLKIFSSPEPEEAANSTNTTLKIFSSPEPEEAANATNTTLKMSSSPRPEEADNSTNTTVLVWSWPFGQKSSLDGNVCKERFGIPNCILVDDRSMYSEADFVIFHNRELINDQSTLPVNQIRPQTQRWVWFSLESPAHNGNVRPFAGLFNCTMSYRRDADIYIPYGRLVPKDSGQTNKDFIPKKKSSLACWVVSNFAAHHRRTDVYNRLKRIIPVDVYGGAVNKRLHADSLLPTISRCYFYLSFENSIYKDYITEKLWYNAFEGGAVPVVLGPPREQYEAVVPKDSFIHVDDFRSLEELGEFLKELANDTKRYESYFNWRLNYTVEVFNDWSKEFCKTCLTVKSLQKLKVYKDLHDWEKI